MNLCMPAFIKRHASQIFVRLTVVSAMLAAYHVYKMICFPQVQFVRHSISAALWLVNMYGFLKRPFWFWAYWYFGSTILLVQINPITTEDWPDIFSIPFIACMTFIILVTVLLDLDSNARYKRPPNC